ncbi:MAG: preprotein translocase subunit SecE [Candidatus Pacebacteria bacterium]|nr:preprotein translocase subunit SecE [Candidatus Paceibacterota bacterium]
MLTGFLAGAILEMKKITWPTRQETIKYTIIVIGICVIVAAFLGLWDLLYMYLLNKFVF